MGIYRPNSNWAARCDPNFVARQNQSLICFPVSADLCAASRISTTIMFASRDERPVGLISPRTTAARYEIGSAFAPVTGGGVISVSLDIFAVRTRNKFGGGTNT